MRRIGVSKAIYKTLNYKYLDDPSHTQAKK